MPTSITIQPHKTDITNTGTDGSQANITLSLAVTPNPAKNTLHQYNLPEATSLHPATGLQSLFPGLQLRATIKLDTQHPAALIQQHRPQPETGDELHIHSPGEEHHILNALAEANLLNTFSQLTLLAHEVPMYQNAQPAQTTLAWLEEQGFEHKTTTVKDPDWPIYQLIRNPLQNTVDALSKELTDARAAQENSQARARQQSEKQQVLQQQLDDQKTRNIKLVDENQALQEQLQQTQTTMEELKTSLSKELQQRKEQIEQLQAESIELKQQLQQRIEQMEQLQAERDELKQHKQQVEQLQTERGELKQQLHQRKQHAEQLQAERDELKQQLQQRKEQVKQLQAEQDELKQQLQQRKEQTEQLQTKRNELRQQGEQLQNEIQNLKESWNKLKAQHDKLQAEHQTQKNELEQKNAKLANLSQQLEQTTKERQQLQKELASQNITQNALNTLQERMEYLFGQNTLQLEQAANALGQHINYTAQHTARELEASLILQQQLGPDTPALGHNENSLPKSAALLLARQLKNQSYDVIIELGSGATTSLMAHALKHSNYNGQRQDGDQKKLAQYVEASEADLPKRILSFEHNRSRHNELSQKLKTDGLASYVSLQFSPLVPLHTQGKEQLFYDCANRLQQLAQLFTGRLARILILINQAEDNTRADTSAALPALLQYLSAHTLEIVVNVQENTYLPDQWLSLLKERGLEHTSAKIFGAVPVQHITVNP